MLIDEKTAPPEERTKCVHQVMVRLATAFEQTASWLEGRGFSSTAAEEAVHAAMHKGVDDLAKVLIQKPESWLRTAAMNAAFKLKIRQQRHLPLDEAREARPAEDTTLRDEAVGAVTEALRGLPEDLREVILLIRYEGISPKKVAKILKVDVGTVHRRRLRAEMELRRRLRRFDGPEK